MILVIDNYDSFTYNLVQLVASRRVEVEVVRNDVESAAAMLARGAEGIILSPGPGRPENAGVCVELVAAEPEVPLLGVCLGHQVLAAAYGATIDRAPRLMHGKTSRIRHLERGLLVGLENPFEATRYHSLQVREETLPAVLEPVAWSEDGTVMAIAHRELPYTGVQFHPESVLTAAGPRLVDRFLELCRQPAGTGGAGA